MAKNSTLDSSLVADKLVDVVDNVRRKIHSKLGTRPWTVAIVTRRWSGEERGVGTATVTVLELDPTPSVKRNTRDRLGPAGREAAGTTTLTGVSLRYTEAELAPKVDNRTEVAYRLTEGHGQRQKTRWFVIASAPVARRGDQPGDGTDWYIVLNETSDMGPLDGVTP
jgi:hypothetical protein